MANLEGKIGSGRRLIFDSSTDAVLVSIWFWNTFEFAVKKSKCTSDIFLPFFYMHEHEAESTQQHIEIVNISAEGSESRYRRQHTSPTTSSN